MKAIKLSGRSSRLWMVGDVPTQQDLQRQADKVAKEYKTKIALVTDDGTTVYVTPVNDETSGEEQAHAVR